MAIQMGRCSCPVGERGRSVEEPASRGDEGGRNKSRGRCVAGDSDDEGV